MYHPKVKNLALVFIIIAFGAHFRVERTICNARQLALNAGIHTLVYESHLRVS